MAVESLPNRNFPDPLEENEPVALGSLPVDEYDSGNFFFCGSLIVNAELLF